MINTLRLSDLQMSRMISGLISDSDSIGESFARSVWSLITEPGDSFASALISTLGAKEALVAEVNRISAAQYIKLIKAAGFSRAFKHGQCRKHFLIRFIPKSSKHINY